MGIVYTSIRNARVHAYARAPPLYTHTRVRRLVYAIAPEKAPGASYGLSAPRWYTCGRLRNMRHVDVDRGPLAGLDTKPYAPVSQENLERLVTDMGLEPGSWVSCADIYLWYTGMCREAKLEALSQNAFGRAMTNLGYEAKARRVGGKLIRSRYMTKDAFPDDYVPPGWIDKHTPPGWE